MSCQKLWYKMKNRVYTNDNEQHITMLQVTWPYHCGSFYEIKARNTWKTIVYMWLSWLKDELWHLPLGHIWRDRKTISPASTPYRVLILWKIDEDQGAYVDKPLSVGVWVRIVVPHGHTLTAAWRPYWIQSENNFSCMDNPYDAN